MACWNPRMAVRWKALVVSIILIMCSTQYIHAAKKKRKTSATPLTNVDEQQGPQGYCVWDMDLVSESTSPTRIVEHHAAYHENTTHKAFAGPTLAYVTPWNRRGYDIAVKFGCKLEFVSPVWFVIRWEDDDIQISGQHEVDADWIRELKTLSCENLAEHGRPRIVPRFRWEINDAQAAQNVLLFPNALGQAIKKVVDQFGFDGVVLELWRELAGMGAGRSDKGRSALHSLIAAVAAPLRGDGKAVVLVIPPLLAFGEQAREQLQEAGYPVEDDFLASDYKALADAVDHVSLMTYDWGPMQRGGGPNAPLGWVEGNLVDKLGEREASSDAEGGKVLVGLNWYGYTYSAKKHAEALLGSDYIALLKKHNPRITYDDEVHEHTFTVKDGGQATTVWFPTLQSISTRIELARRYGGGLSIWELGQGLDYWLDLL